MQREFSTSVGKQEKFVEYSAIKKDGPKKSQKIRNTNHIFTKNIVSCSKFGTPSSPSIIINNLEINYREIFRRYLVVLCTFFIINKTTPYYKLNIWLFCSWLLPVQVSKELPAACRWRSSWIRSKKKTILHGYTVWGVATASQAFLCCLWIFRGL